MLTVPFSYSVTFKPWHASSPNTCKIQHREAVSPKGASPPLFTPSVYTRDEKVLFSFE